MRILIVDSFRQTTPLALLSAKLAAAGHEVATVLPMANSAAEPAPLFGTANAIALGEDGWALIPYGDTTHNGANAERANGLAEVKGKPGVIQRFTPERAQAMANAFHSLRGKIKRAVVGMDIYKGHPDCAAFANLFPDKSPRGAIADMQARPEGLAFKPVLNERGVADVEDGWDHFSPFWFGECTGEEHGIKIYEPVRLKSIGLVGGAGSGRIRGNIPGLSLVNADPLSATMKKELIQLLALLGITVPPETAETPEAFAPFLADAKTKVEGMKPKADLDKAEGELAAANARIATLQGEHATALVNAKAEGENALKAFRTGAAGVVVTAAIAAGRIPAAERETQLTALANASDFAAAATALAAKPAKLPTGSRLGDLGASGKEQAGRQEQLLGLVNAEMEKNGGDYEKAFTTVEASAAGKAILSAMKRPEAAAK